MEISRVLLIFLAPSLLIRAASSSGYIWRICLLHFTIARKECLFIRFWYSIILGDSDHCHGYRNTQEIEWNLPISVLLFLRHYRADLWESLEAVNSFSNITKMVLQLQLFFKTLCNLIPNKLSDSFSVQ